MPGSDGRRGERSLAQVRGTSPRGPCDPGWGLGLAEGPLLARATRSFFLPGLGTEPGIRVGLERSRHFPSESLWIYVRGRVLSCFLNLSLWGQISDVLLPLGFFEVLFMCLAWPVKSQHTRSTPLSALVATCHVVEFGHTTCSLWTPRGRGFPVSPEVSVRPLARVNDILSSTVPSGRAEEACFRAGTWPREVPGSRNTASIGAAAHSVRSACTVSPSGLGPEPGSGSPVLSGRPAVSPPFPPVPASR